MSSSRCHRRGTFRRHERERLDGESNSRATEMMRRPLKTFQARTVRSNHGTEQVTPARIERDGVNLSPDAHRGQRSCPASPRPRLRVRSVVKPGADEVLTAGSNAGVDADVDSVELLLVGMSQTEVPRRRRRRSR